MSQICMQNFSRILILLSPQLKNLRGRNTSLANIQKISEFLFSVIITIGPPYIFYFPIYLYRCGAFTSFMEYVLFYDFAVIIFTEVDMGIEHFSEHHNDSKMKASLNIFLLLITERIIISNKDAQF